MLNKYVRFGSLYIFCYYRFLFMCEEVYEVNFYFNFVLWFILNFKLKIFLCLFYIDCSWCNVSVYNSYVYILDD